jgi:hypothetical protein
VKAQLAGGAGDADCGASAAGCAAALAAAALGRGSTDNVTALVLCL